MRKSSIFWLFSILIISALFTDTLQARSYKMITVGGFGYGGETLISRTSDNHSIMKMGDGQFFGFGVEVKTIKNRDDLSTALSAAWLADWAGFFSGGLLSRFPLSLTQYYTINKWQFGAGLTYHVGNKFYADEDTGLGDIKFDNAFGSTLSLTYDLHDAQSRMGVQATFIKYKAQDYRFTNKLDGNNIGFFYKTSF